jgi:hypothetical protein
MMEPLGLPIEKNQKMENQETISGANQNQSKNAPASGAWFLRFLYVAFVLLALGYFIFGDDLSDSVINLGIALAFDPFDPTQPWKQRPLYQRVWLFVHLGLTLTGFVFMLLQ